MHVRQRSTENLLYHLILFYVKFEESNLISGTLQYIEDCLIGNFNFKKLDRQYHVEQIFFTR